MAKMGKKILEEAMARRAEALAKREAAIDVADRVVDVNFVEVGNALQGGREEGNAQEERKMVGKADRKKS